MRTENLTKDGVVFLSDENAEISVSAGAAVSVWGLFTKRGEYRVTLASDNPNTSLSFTALVLLTGGGSLSLATHQYHRLEGATSDVLVKSVLDKGADFRFTGTISIGKNAQVSDAYQRNENLLLDTASTARSEPILEIEANQVRCTHGATIRPVSRDIGWYLSSRGITPSRARELEAAGFVRAAFSRAADPAMNRLVTGHFRRKIQRVNSALMKDPL